jgi:nucleoside-diphosphate-sugar epimerase
VSGKDITVFVAGGSGTIGRPLVRACVAAGHRVVATTRSSSKCVNRTGFVGGLIPREDGAHGTTKQIFTGVT